MHIVKLLQTWLIETQDFLKKKECITKMSEGCFNWSFITPQCKKESPSPRNGHTGWEYGGNLWIFGGMGPSHQGFLNDHGDISDPCINQLLCFNPNTTKWTNPQCFGAAPSPRLYHTSTIIRNKVWLFDLNIFIQKKLIGRGIERDIALSLSSGCWEDMTTAGIFIPLSSHCTL